MIKSQFRLLMVSFLCFSMSLPTMAAPANSAASKEAAKVAAAERFEELVRNPEARTYRQMLQAIKPFSNEEFIEEVTKKVGSQIDDRFPRYEMKELEKSYQLKVGKDAQAVTMEILKDDPAVFARYNGGDILVADMLNDPLYLINRMEELASKDGKNSMMRKLFLPDARAFEWSSLVGPLIIGGGILAAGWMISSAIKSKNDDGGGSNEGQGRRRHRGYWRLKPGDSIVIRRANGTRKVIKNRAGQK